ncbi:MAG: hypothetical protein HOW73_37630 [Polyangiaceae bacterium]|nr:hypothetical protein [Polyangiaceae bacterium]
MTQSTQPDSLPSMRILLPEPGVGDARATIAALVAFDDPERSASFGELTEPSFIRFPNGRPLRGSPLAQEIFGPIVDHRCACGLLASAAHDGEVCERCGVACLPAASRGERWGHVAVPFGFIHPALAPTIGVLLGCSAADVLAVARCEAWWTGDAVCYPAGTAPSAAGPRSAIWEIEPEESLTADPAERRLLEVNTALRRLGSLPAWAEEQYGAEESWFEAAARACGPAVIARALASLDAERRARFDAEHGAPPEALLLRRFPVPPPDLRPLEPRPGGIDQPGPDGIALGRLVARVNVARDYQGEDTSVPVLEVRRRVQVAAERAALAFAGVATDPDEAGIVSELGPMHGPPSIDPGYPVPEYRSQLAAVTGLAFVDDDTLLVDLPYATVRLALRSGRIRDVWRSARLRLLSTDTAGKYAFYAAPHADRACFAAIDLRSMTWLEQVPPQLGVVPALDASAPEVVLVNTSTLRAHPTGGWSDRFALSPCGRFTWATNIQRITGELELEPWWDGYGLEAPLALRDDGTLGPPDEDNDGADWDSSARALTLCGDRWKLVDAGYVFRGLQPILRLELTARAAAFDRAGRLAVATDHWVALVDLDEPRVLTRWSLRRLRRMLALPHRGMEVPFGALHAALCSYGTLPEVAAFDTATLAALDTAMFGGGVPMGEADAERVLACARGKRVPARLQRPRKAGPSNAY